jgi:Neuraminidase (sialidase)
MLLYGPPGVGKSSLAAKVPNVLFLATEPGQQFLEAPVVEIPDWYTFRAALVGLNQRKQAVAEGKMPPEEMPYTAFAIDIIDNLHGMCRDFICQAKGIAYPPQNDFGKTWKEVTTEWTTWLGNLMRLGNIIFISHATFQAGEITNEAGATESVEVAVPTFSGNKAAQYLDGILNAMGYLSISKEGDHVITFQKSSTIGAKDRTGILASLGTMPSDWDGLAKAYEEKAISLGKEVKSRKV